MTDKKENRKKSEIKKSCWRHDPTSIFTFFIALFTGVLAVVGWQQSSILDETMRTARIIDQAYIYFLDPKVFPYPNKKDPITTGVTITIHNAGNVPSRLLSIKSGWTEDKEKVVDLFKSDKLQKKMETGFFISPKQPMAFQGQEIPKNIYKKAKTTLSNIFLLMEVKYTDGFDDKKVRITRTCRVLQFDSVGGESLGFVYNCVDDDCE